MDTPEPLALKWVDGGDIARLVDAVRNQTVTAYLAEGRSCHSDNGEALLRSAEGWRDWIAFSPSFGQCRYVALIANRIIFALGLGQRWVCYRLSEASAGMALMEGAAEARHIGTHWVTFELFRPGAPEPDLAFWTGQAYTTARDHSAGA